MLIEVYKFLHDNYDKRKEWKLIHHFVYNFTMVLAIAMPIVVGLGIITSVVMIFTQHPLFPCVAKITGGCVVGAVLFWSTMNWIEHQ